jgi:RHS repeat-associated protein
VYFGGKRISHRVVSSNSVYYYAEDMLGSSRAMGTSTGTPCYDADFYPYGGEHDYVNTCAQNYKFTGKERDPETNNDDFDARYYSSAYGRFLSADWSSTPSPVPYANLTNPQTLNLYAMVSDNPESFADLDGHENAAPNDPSKGACAESGTSACGTQIAEQNSATAQNQTAQNQQGDQSQTQANQPPTPDKPPSWDPTKPLPDDPSKLGPDWKPDTDHKAPNDKRYKNPKGDKLDWHKGKPGEKGWKGKDHWHWNEHDWHFEPGDKVARVATVIAVGVAAYWTVSEATRILFPPRNAIPLP